MDSWIFQGGHPVVTAAAGDDGAITLSQERFRYDGQPDDSRWQVPVVVALGTDAESRTERLVLEDPAVLEAGDSGWVMVNAGADGFYRVAYEGGLLERLLSDKGPELDPLQRYVLVDDQWALTVAGRLDVAGYLAFAERIAAAEDDLAVWRRLAGTLGSLDHMVSNDGRAGLQARVRNLLGPALDRVGWELARGEDDRTGELRGVLVRTLALCGDDAEAVARCRELMASESVDPALAAAAIAVVAATGNQADYEEIRQRFQNPPTPQLELRYLMALTAFNDSELMNRTLAATLDGTVRSQDAGFLVRGCLENRGPRPSGVGVHRRTLGRHQPAAPLPGHPPDAERHLRPVLP